MRWEPDAKSEKSLVKANGTGAESVSDRERAIRSRI